MQVRFKVGHFLVFFVVALALVLGACLLPFCLPSSCQRCWQTPQRHLVCATFLEDYTSLHWQIPKHTARFCLQVSGGTLLIETGFEVVPRAEEVLQLRLVLVVHRLPFSINLFCNPKAIHQLNFTLQFALTSDPNGEQATLFSIEAPNLPCLPPFRIRIEDLVDPLPLDQYGLLRLGIRHGSQNLGQRA